MGMRWGVSGVIFLSLTASHVAPAAPTPSCIVGRFLVLDGGPFFPGQSASGIDVITFAPSAMDMLVSLASGCPPQSVTIRQTGAAIRVATRWQGCDGARLHAVMP